MSIFQFLFQEPLLRWLVILNIVPVVILSVVQLFRYVFPNKRKIHVIRPDNPLYSQVLNPARTRQPTDKPVIFMTNFKPQNASSSTPPQINFLGNSSESSDLDLDKTKNENKLDLQEERMSENCYNNLMPAERLLMESKQMKRSKRTLSPNTPFDF